jgi:DNA invertase Pin-like site-specific DNA recombinase
MKVAIYCRVSDDKLRLEGQRRQDIDRQLDKLKKLCEVQKLGEPLIFRDDALSAFKDDYNSRPEFCKLLREIRARRVQRVLVEDLTRWSRRVEDGLKTMKEAAEFGCTVTSAAEGEVDITMPDGWFRCALAFMMAEWASRSLSWKVKSGMDRLRNNKEKICASCGIVHLGRHPASCNCKRCIKKKG